MKKSLVLAMAMALGVTASAYAANPFSDVPAGHWAYDSISKLAAAGIIEGYGDDTFRGDRLMTRYEMAQIVAKALAKGANVDKLAAEFADELDALGVRVAALEKKSDNVKITGQIRWRYRLQTNRDANGNKGRTHDLRSRITFTGKVNDNWNYVGMVENIQDFKDNVGNETTNFQRAYLQGRLGGAKVTAGRYHEELIGGDSDIYSNRIDGIKAEYGDKIKLMGYYGKMTALGAEELVEYDADGNVAVATPATKPTAWGAHLDFALGKKANLFIGYDELKEKDTLSIEDYSASGKIKLFDVGAKAKLGDVNLTAIYLHGKADEDFYGDLKKNGFTFEAAYKGAVASKPGSWGLNAKYYNQGAATYWSHGGNGPLAFAAGDAEGFKGFRVSGNYTFAKNMVYTMSYYDLKGKGDNAAKRKTWYNQLIVTF